MNYTDSLNNATNNDLTSNVTNNEEVNKMTINKDALKAYVGANLNLVAALPPDEQVIVLTLIRGKSVDVPDNASVALLDIIEVAVKPVVTVPTIDLIAAEINKPALGVRAATATGNAFGEAYVNTKHFISDALKTANDVRKAAKASAGVPDAKPKSTTKIKSK